MARSRPNFFDAVFVFQNGALLYCLCPEEPVMAS
jgi:hypothetical protein